MLFFAAHRPLLSFVFHIVHSQQQSTQNVDSELDSTDNARALWDPIPRGTISFIDSINLVACEDQRRRARLRLDR